MSASPIVITSTFIAGLIFLKLGLLAKDEVDPVLSSADIVSGMSSVGDARRFECPSSSVELVCDCLATVSAKKVGPEAADFCEISRPSSRSLSTMFT